MLHMTWGAGIVCTIKTPEMQKISSWTEEGTLTGARLPHPNAGVRAGRITPGWFRRVEMAIDMNVWHMILEDRGQTA